MEQLLLNVVTNIPNFAVAIIMLFWQRQTIDRLLDTQAKLVDRLLDYVDRDKARAAAALATSVPTAPVRER